jgi:hypothetical protein
MGSRGRFGFWFPLVLLGFLTLGGIVLVDRPWTPSAGAHVLSPRLPGLGTGGMSGTGLGGYTPDSNTVLISITQVSDSYGGATPFPAGYWVAGVFAVFLATVVFYAWSSGRRRLFAWVGLYGLVAIAGLLLVTDIVARQPDLRTTIGGSLTAMGLCAAAWVYFRLGPGRNAVTAIGAICLPIGFAALLVGTVAVSADQWVVTVGLLALAWFERSWLLAAVAGLVFVVAWAFLPETIGLVLAASVLLVGGIAALMLRNMAGRRLSTED